MHLMYATVLTTVPNKLNPGTGLCCTQPVALCWLHGSRSFAGVAFDPEGSGSVLDVGCASEQCVCGRPACGCSSQQQCTYSRTYGALHQVPAEDPCVAGFRRCRPAVSGATVSAVEHCTGRPAVQSALIWGVAGTSPCAHLGFLCSDNHTQLTVST